MMVDDDVDGSSGVYDHDNEAGGDHDLVTPMNWAKHTHTHSRSFSRQNLVTPVGMSFC